MILDCTSIPNSDSNSLLSIVSIVLGILSICLSIWFYVLSSQLSNKTTTEINKIQEATKQLNEIHNRYFEVVFDLFKRDHERFAESQFGDSEPSGKVDDSKNDNK
jgi:hypothetical protein